MSNYLHRYVNDDDMPYQPGKVVCVGRNYLAHIAELGNVVPNTPVLFMKPSTTLCRLDEPIHLPAFARDDCHYEIELAVLIGERLSESIEDEVNAGIAGYALALDLTLRHLQSELKAQGLPWERAKAFDNACPISPFLLPAELPNPQQTKIYLQINGEMRQNSNTQLMIYPIHSLIAHISQQFTLLPGDVVLTGTPAGVGQLQAGDKLVAGLGESYQISTRVL